MDNKILTLCITLVVGVILAGSLLVPVLNSATETERTFENEDYFFTMDKILADDSETHTIVWEATDPDQLTIDGTAFYPDWSGSVTVACIESDIVRCLFVGGDYILNVIGVDLVNGWGWTDHTSITAEFSNGTMTVTRVISGNTQVKTFSYTDAYIINPTGTGEYVMKTPTASAYVLEDSPILGMGLSNFGGSGNNLIRVSGDVTDLTASVVSTPVSSDITIGDLTITSTELTKYRGLYTFDKVEFPVTVEDTTTTITYSYVIVPASVTAELTNHLTPGQIALMSAIPIMVIVALLMVAIGAIAYRRAD